jgi:hypothetical protein
MLGGRWLLPIVVRDLLRTPVGTHEPVRQDIGGGARPESLQAPYSRPHQANPAILTEAADWISALNRELCVIASATWSCVVRRRATVAPAGADRGSRGPASDGEKGSAGASPPI